jgi:hypothetical protein
MTYKDESALCGRLDAITGVFPRPLSQNLAVGLRAQSLDSHGKVKKLYLELYTGRIVHTRRVI